MPKSKVRSRTPEQIIAGARRAERDVTVCLRADLVGQIEALEEELREIAAAKPTDVRLGNSNPEEVAVAEQIVALEEEADDNSITFTIRALPRNEWRAAKAKCPATDEDRALGWLVDRDDLAELVLVESVVKPDIEDEQLIEMAGDLAEGQWSLIRDTILVVNGGDGSVPFSRNASLILQTSTNEAVPLEPTVSPSNASTDGNPAPSPPSPIGKTDKRLGG